MPSCVLPAIQQTLICDIIKAEMRETHGCGVFLTVCQNPANPAQIYFNFIRSIKHRVGMSLQVSRYSNLYKGMVYQLSLSARFYFQANF